MQVILKCWICYHKVFLSIYRYLWKKTITTFCITKLLYLRYSSYFSCRCTTNPYCNLGIVVLISCRPFKTAKTFGDINSLWHAAKGKGTSVFMSLKPIPRPALREIVEELYLRGFEARALWLWWFGGGEGKDGCQNNSSVPTVRMGAAKGSYISLCGSAIFVLYLCQNKTLLSIYASFS